MITNERFYEIIKDLEEKQELIPGIYDVIFKTIIDRCPKYRADLISRITGISKDLIIDTYYDKNKEYTVNNALEKGKISDVLFGIKTHIINIELNNSYFKGIIERNDAYLGKIKNDILRKTENYKDMPIIVQININNFSYFKSKKHILEFKSRELNGEIESLKWVKYHINLKRIIKKYQEEINLSKLEKELLILTLRKVKEIDELSKGDDELMEVAKELKNLTYDIGTIGLYDIEEERRKIENTKIKYAEELGEERGIKNGIKQEKNTIAKNLLNMGISTKDVIKATGLSEKQIKRLI